MKNRFKHYETRTHIGRIWPPSFICSFLPSVHFFPLFISSLYSFLPSIHFFPLCISSLCSFLPSVYFLYLFIYPLCLFLSSVHFFPLPISPPSSSSIWLYVVHESSIPKVYSSIFPSASVRQEPVYFLLSAQDR